MLVKYRGYGFIYSVRDGYNVSNDMQGYLYDGVFSLTGKDENNLKILGKVTIDGMHPIDHPSAPAIIPTEYRNQGFIFVATSERGSHEKMEISLNPLRATTIFESSKLEFLDAIPEEIARQVGGKNYISTDLLTLIEAAEKFWSNADPKERDTHAVSKDVSEWLLEKGFSAISAQQGAAIIRPEWAAKGRRSTD
ncbi:MAG: hypothetical protein WCP96_01470 [Methylococcaceae bacterium]